MFDAHIRIGLERQARPGMHICWLCTAVLHAHAVSDRLVHSLQSTVHLTVCSAQSACHLHKAQYLRVLGAHILFCFNCFMHLLAALQGCGSGNYHHSAGAELARWGSGTQPHSLSSLRAMQNIQKASGVLPCCQTVSVCAPVNECNAHHKPAWSARTCPAQS